MSEVRFKIDPTLQTQLSELREIGGYDSVGAAVKSLITIFCPATLEAIRRGQQAIASGGTQLAASSQPLPTPVTPTDTPTPSAAPTLGGFGESLSSLLKR